MVTALHKSKRTRPFSEEEQQERLTENTVIVYSNCKINLGLNIVAKRTDGYHDIETVFFPLPLHDALEAIQSDQLNFTTSGLPIPGDSGSNLCVRAWHLLKSDFPQLSAVNIHLHKAIPIGGGLGGGSSNGAAMLLLLNKKFHLQLTQQNLVDYSLKLGSDCPFFISNTPQFASGRGEILEQVQLDLAGYKLLLINPGIHISTKEAFAGLTPKKAQKNIQDIIAGPVETWKDDLVNDFESTIFKIYPTIGDIKQKMYDAGAVYASMTGTGSSVFGIFANNHEESSLSFPDYFEKWIKL